MKKQPVVATCPSTLMAPDHAGTFSVALTTKYHNTYTTKNLKPNLKMYTLRLPVPTRSAVQSYMTDWCKQKLIKYVLKRINTRCSDNMHSTVPCVACLIKKIPHVCTQPFVPNVHKIIPHLFIE